MEDRFAELVAICSDEELLLYCVEGMIDLSTLRDDNRDAVVLVERSLEEYVATRTSESRAALEAHAHALFMAIADSLMKICEINERERAAYRMMIEAQKTRVIEPSRLTESAVRTAYGRSGYRCIAHAPQKTDILDEVWYACYDEETDRLSAIRERLRRQHLTATELWVEDTDEGLF